MKRRVIKKNINRFITPLIKNLPKTIYYATDIVEGGHMLAVLKRQHVIVNGYRKKEGERGHHCDEVLLNIKRTADLIRQIRDEYNHVLLRIGPEVRGNRVYVRLITE